jgi:predicted amidohydrolase YtcJ
MAWAYTIEDTASNTETVDDRFSVAQAIAIRGKRFVAVGTIADITRLAGPNTHKIDLGGKSVIPGFIDAHAHLMRAAETWAIEARFDAVPEPEVGLPSIGPKPAA